MRIIVLAIILSVLSAGCTNPLKRVSSETEGSEKNAGVRDTFTLPDSVDKSFQNVTVHFETDTLKGQSKYAVDRRSWSGTTYERHAKFVDTTSGLVIKKIDFVFKDNPVVKAGFEIDHIDGAKIFYRLPSGINTTKREIEAFLPASQINEIPDNIGEEYALGIISRHNFPNAGHLVLVNEFSCIGLYREHIRGDFGTTIYQVYNYSGKKIFEHRVEGFKYSNPNTDYNIISDDGRMACIRYEVNREDFTKRKVITDFIDLSVSRLVFREEERIPNDGYQSFYIWNNSITTNQYLAINHYIKESNLPTKIKKILIYDKEEEAFFGVKEAEIVNYDLNTNYEVILDKRLGVVNKIKQDTQFYTINKLNKFLLKNN